MEWCERVFVGERNGGTLAGAVNPIARQIDNGQVERRGPGYALARQLPVAFNEPHTQRRMSSGRLSKRFVQRIDIERATQAQRDRNVVGRAVRLRAPQE